MRILTTNLLAVALLLFGATSASAYAYDWAVRGGVTDGLTTSDNVIIDVFLDAEPGLVIASMSVIYPGDGTIFYDGVATAALPPSIYNTTAFGNGAQPTYILYTPGGMLSPTTYLTPLQSPTWLNFPNPPPGYLQVNIDYTEVGLNPASASGTGIYVGTLLFHIEPGFSGTTLQLCVDCPGNGIFSGGTSSEFQVPTSDIGLGADIVLTGTGVPEPTTAMLIGLGVLGLAVAGRRRA